MKPGYKLTEVGVVPKDWEVAPLGELCTKIQDGTHFSPRIRGGDFLYVTSKNIRFGVLDVSDASRIDAGQHAAIYRRCDVSRGDLLLTKDGANTGNAALNTLSEPFSLLSSVAFLRFDARRHDAAFFLQQVLSQEGQRRIKDAMSGNAITRLTLEKIHNLRFPYAPLREQRAIAAALSDVDALLGGLDRLIAKKLDIKQAAMQQVLTGQTRLPGFHGEWEVASLSTLCAMKSGEGITSADIDDFSTYPCYGGNGLRGYTSRFTHDGGFALIGRQGALCGNVVGVEGKFFASEHAVVVTPNSKADIRWLTYVLARMNLNQYSESSAQPGLSVSKILMLDLDIPPSKAEQSAIASVLSDMDVELSALEAQRDKTRALKQGMMQELLTGGTRLVPAAGAHA